MDEWGVTKAITPEVNHLGKRSAEIDRVRPGGSGRQSVATAALVRGPRGGAPPPAAPGLRDGWGGVPPPQNAAAPGKSRLGGVHLTTNAAIRRGRYPPPEALPYIIGGWGVLNREIVSFHSCVRTRGLVA